MKSLLKTIIPTLVPFLLFARYTALDSAHRNFDGPLTEISVQSLMHYFMYLAPLIYVILFLTQIVVIMPLWNRAYYRSAQNAWFLALVLLLVSFILSAGIGYMIWDPANGMGSLYRSVSTLFYIQAVYWMVNMFIMYLIDSAFKWGLKPLQS